MGLYSLCIKCKKKIAYRVTRCDDCQREYNKYIESKRDKQRADFYRSYRWQKLRKQVLEDNNYMCMKCKERGRVREATEVHHIEQLATNWSKRLDYDNLMALCYDCHHEIHD